MGGVDGEAMARGARHGLVEVLVVDAELCRARAAVQALRVTAHHPFAGIEAQPDGSPWAAPPDAVDLREQIHVDVQREGRDDVEVARRDVGARVADLLGREAAGEGVLYLARRTGVEADRLRVAGRCDASQKSQQGRLAEGLEREPHAVAQSGAGQRGLQGARDLGDTQQVVHVPVGVPSRGQAPRRRVPRRAGARRRCAFRRAPRTRVWSPCMDAAYRRRGWRRSRQAGAGETGTTTSHTVSIVTWLAPPEKRTS